MKKVNPKIWLMAISLLANLNPTASQKELNQMAARGFAMSINACDYINMLLV